MHQDLIAYFATCRNVSFKRITIDSILDIDDDLTGKIALIVFDRVLPNRKIELQEPVKE